MNSILTKLIIFYGLGKLYSWLFKKEHSPLFKIDDYSKADASGLQRVFYPIATAFAFIVNIFGFYFWFIGELLHWIIEGVKWLYNEVFVSFLLLVFKVLWNYAIVWPWKILLITIQQFVPSIKFNLFLTAAIGIFLTLSINHFGNIFFNNTYLLQHIIPYLSIIPIGIACTKIVHKLKSSDKFKWYASDYLNHSMLIVLTLGVIYFLEIKLIALGTYSSSSSLISSFLTGTALCSAALIIFNAILCIFILNALPSFSIENPGLKRLDLFRKFGQYLLKNGLMYILALPFILIAFVIITYIPYKITHSLALPAKHMTDKAISNKIIVLKEKKASLDTILKHSKKSLSNIKLISNDSLNTLFNLEKNAQAAEIQILNSMHLKEELYSYYSNFEDSLGAMPLAILLRLNKKASSYLKNESNKIPKLKYITLDTSIFNEKINDLKLSIANDSNSIKDTDAKLKALNSELTWVNCKMPEVNSNSEPKEGLKKDSVISVENTNTCNTDSCLCLNRKASLKKEINYTKSQRDTLVLQKARHNAISNHLLYLKSNRINAIQTGQNVSSIGSAVLLLWYFIIISITFALGLVLFARVNHALYGLSNNDSPLYLISKYNEVNKNNSNQPFLGMVIFGITFIYLSATVSTWYLNPKQITKRVWNEIKNFKSEIVQSHYLNPTHWNKTWGINYWSEFKAATSTPSQNNNVVEKNKTKENPIDTLYKAIVEGLPQANPNDSLNKATEDVLPPTESSQIDQVESEAPVEAP